jgi:hypothetical protein
MVVKRLGVENGVPTLTLNTVIGTNSTATKNARQDGRVYLKLTGLSQSVQSNVDGPRFRPERSTKQKWSDG